MKSNSNVIIALAAVAAIAINAHADSITWQTSPKEAKKVAARENKLIMQVHLATGEQAEKIAALHHPFVVDAAEQFVSCKNAGVKSEVQFLNASGRKLGDEISIGSGPGPILAAMKAALLAGKEPIPKYLDLVGFEVTAKERARATLCGG